MKQPSPLRRGGLLVLAEKRAAPTGKQLFFDLPYRNLKESRTRRNAYS